MELANITNRLLQFISKKRKIITLYHSVMEEITVNSLGFLLDRALWTLSSTLNATLKEKGIDLPHSQYIIMRFLDEKEGISQNKLAILLHKDAAAIKRSIDNLEKKDYSLEKHFLNEKRYLSYR